MIRRRFLALSLAAAAVLCAACGPDATLRTGVSAQATDLLLGALAVPAPAAPVGVPVPSFPGVVVTPTKPIVIPPVLAQPPKPVACPALDPLTAPDKLASLTVDGKPAEGGYPFRVSGTSTLDGTKKATLGKAQTRTVTQLPTTTPLETSRFRVDTTSFDGAKVSTTYSEIPAPLGQSVTIPGLPIGTSPITISAPGGLYIVSMTTSLGGTQTTFTPTTPGLRIFDEPAAPTKTWVTTAIDPASQVLLLMTGSYGTHKKVNACGTPVDGWDVTLKTTILGLSENLTQTQHLVIAPQYGGLIVGEDTTISGTVNGHAVEQTTSATIDSLKPAPLVAKAAS